MGQKHANMIFFSNHNCCWLAIVALLPCIAATSQLLDVLASTSELSTVLEYINYFNLTSYFIAAENFTFLAPSNDAIVAYGNAKGTTISAERGIMALLQYSLLQGIYPSLSFTNESQFVPSYLLNSTYANVTGGQRVELSLNSNGLPQVISGNKTVSVSQSTVCTSLREAVEIRLRQSLVECAT